MNSEETADTRCRRWGAFALTALIAGAAAGRAWLLWNTPLVPGMNGAYYLIQARALLEHGTLGIPDLPLTFLVQAAAAKLLQAVTGRSLEASILLSVRLCDAFLPPLVAVPVYLLGRSWCRQAGRSFWPAAAAAAVVALGAPALSMTGDFEKNSLGLVWLAGLVASLHAWMSRRTRGGAAAVIAFLGLCGLTHIGVFGAALLLAALTWGADLALLRGKEGLRHLRHALVTAAIAAAVAALAAGLVLWKFDPARVRRLAGALSHPVVFLQTGGHTEGQGLDLRAGPMPSGPPDRFGAPSGPQPRGPNRRRMGPPGMGNRPEGLASLPFGLVALGALVLPWHQRHDLPAADRATTIGCAVSVILLAGPWVQGDVAMRLWLIAMIPATVCAAYVLAHLPGRWTASVCSAACLALLAATSVPLLRRGGHATVTPEAIQELRTLSQHLAQPDRTLIVARHGLEWWTAWTLHTHVAQARAVRADDWSKYGEILFLQEKRAVGPGGFASRGGHRPDDLFREAPPPGFGGPPGAGGLPAFGVPGGAPPMLEAEIPQNAEVLHDGAHFRLARVREAPASVIRPPQVPAASRPEQ